MKLNRENPNAQKDTELIITADEIPKQTERKSR